MTKLGKGLIKGMKESICITCKKRPIVFGPFCELCEPKVNPALEEALDRALKDNSGKSARDFEKGFRLGFMELMNNKMRRSELVGQVLNELESDDLTGELQWVAEHIVGIFEDRGIIDRKNYETESVEAYGRNIEQWRNRNNLG